MLGLCSVSFRKHRPEEILQGMQAAGLSCIEWGSDVHAPIDKAEEIAALQKKHGITCCSYGTYFRVGVTPADELEGYIRAAKILGADTLRLWCGNKNAEDYTQTEAQTLFAQCKALAEIAQKHSVTLCMECHSGTYANSRAAILMLMEQVAHPAFRMYWQPQQHHSFEENLACAKAVSPFVKNIHIFNWKGEEKYPLQAAVDIWKAYLDCFDGTQTLLLEFMPDGRLESLAREADALARILR